MLTTCSSEIDGKKTKLGFFLSVHVNDMNMVGKKQNMDLVWRILQREIDSEGSVLPWHDQYQSGTKLVARRLSRLISYINRTEDFRQFCHVRNFWRWQTFLFRDASFADGLRDPSQRQEVCCAYSDHIRLLQFHGCARSKPQILTAVPSLKLFRLVQIHEWPAYKRFNYGTVCLKRYPISQPRGTFFASSTRTSHVLSLTFWYLCFWVNWPCSGQHSQQLSFHSTRSFEDNAAVVQMIHKGRSPHLRHVTRTHRVDIRGRTWTILFW